MLALLRCLEAAPHASEAIISHLANHPAPLDRLLDGSGPSTLHAARVILRTLQDFSSSRQLWSWGPWLELLAHADPDCRWTAIQGCSVIFSLSDDARARLATRAFGSQPQTVQIEVGCTRVTACLAASCG